MKLYIEKTPMTQAEAEAGQKDGKRLATASSAIATSIAASSLLPVAGCFT